MALALAMGGELIVYILIGVFAGEYMGEKYLGTTNWGAVIGTGIGFTIWVLRMVRVNNQQSENE